LKVNGVYLLKGKAALIKKTKPVLIIEKDKLYGGSVYIPWEFRYLNDDGTVKPETDEGIKYNEYYGHAEVFITIEKAIEELKAEIARLEQIKMITVKLSDKE